MNTNNDLQLTSGNQLDFSQTFVGGEIKITGGVNIVGNENNNIILGNRSYTLPDPGLSFLTNPPDPRLIELNGHVKIAGEKLIVGDVTLTAEELADYRFIRNTFRQQHIEGILYPHLLPVRAVVSYLYTFL